MCSRKQMTASPDPLRVRGVWHVCPCRLLHGLLVELVFRERSGAKWTDPERGGDADFRYGRLRGGRCAGRCRRTREDIYKEEKRKKSQSFGQCLDILEACAAATDIYVYHQIRSVHLTCQNVSSGKKKKSDHSDLCPLGAGWQSLHPGLIPALLSQPSPSES